MYYRHKIKIELYDYNRDILLCLCLVSVNIKCPNIIHIRLMLLLIVEGLIMKYRTKWLSFYKLKYFVFYFKEHGNIQSLK